MVNTGSPIVINSDSVPGAWAQMVRKIRKSENGVLQNILVHVEKPKREVPKSLIKHEDQINSWALELQSTKPSRLPFTHGQRIFSWSQKQKNLSRFDQISDFVVPMLLRNPKTKRAMAIITDPTVDATMTDNPIPALLLVQFGLVEGRINVTAYYRAQEMYFFWVVNMFELISLQEKVCGLMQSRSPDINIKPGNITTFAFTGYINPVDLGKVKKTGSSTLAIERFGISNQKNLEGLLESALIEGNNKNIKKLLQLISDDKQKLDRIRDIDYKGLELWQNFIESNKNSLLEEFEHLPDILQRVIFDLVSLDMGLEHGEDTEEIRKRIDSADKAMQELVDILKQRK